MEQPLSDEDDDNGEDIEVENLQGISDAVSLGSRPHPIPHGLCKES